MDLDLIKNMIRKGLQEGLALCFIYGYNTNLFVAKVQAKFISTTNFQYFPYLNSLELIINKDRKVLIIEVFDEFLAFIKNDLDFLEKSNCLGIFFINENEFNCINVDDNKSLLFNKMSFVKQRAFINGSLLKNGNGFLTEKEREDSYNGTLLKKYIYFIFFNLFRFSALQRLA